MVSSKFSYPPKERTAQHYRAAVEAEKLNDLKATIVAMKQVVAADPGDFIGWAHLGTLHFREHHLADAEAAFRKSISLREEFTPAWINMGKLRTAQKQFEAAVEIFKHAAAIEPENAKIFRMLGDRIYS